MKNYRNFLSTLYFKLYMLFAAPLYSPVLWQWPLTLHYFLSFKCWGFFSDFSGQIWFLLLFNFIIFFLKLIIFIVFSLKYSQNFFIHSLPRYTSSLFYMLLNEDIVDIEKLDGICLLNFLIFRIIFTSISLFYYTLKICKGNNWCLNRYLVLIKF